MFTGKVFHIYRPKVVRVFVPYLVVLCLLTIRLFGQILGIKFRGKNIFHKGTV